MIFTSDSRDDHAEVYSIKTDGTDRKRMTFTLSDVECYAPSWSAVGGKLAFQYSRYGWNQIWTVNAADGSGLKRLTNTAWQSMAPAWSPNGAKIAFSRRLPSPATNFQIFTMDASGLNVLRRTFNTANDANPTWSSDGQYLAFQSNRKEARNEIFSMNKDGLSVKRLTFAGGEHPSWGP